MPIIPTILGPIFVDDRGGADQPAALLWPSLFTDHSMWDAQVAALRGAGWRTLALDPPGHGQSVGPGRRFTMDECAEAALQVLDAQGVRAPVVVLGTSWGGFVAPRLALRAPDRVRGLVTFNTSAQEALPFQKASATLLVRMLAVRSLDGVTDRIIRSTLLAPETRARRPKIGLDLMRRFRSWGRPQMVDTVRSVLLDRTSVLEALPAVACPALIVSGAKDTVLPTKLSLTIAQRLPRARHVEVPDAAHLVPLEAPEAASRLVLDFVGSIGSGRQPQP